LIVIHFSAERAGAGQGDWPMNRAHEQLVDAQFGPRAKAYVESAVHARGPDLEALESVVSGVRPARALDLGTGGGHVAYLMARHAGAVTASDLSREMLAAVAAAAGKGV
jgi:2-polyprenyl-3-methyl-5-hydroxy-6-metoxy-1,4-benzoquinol methylase